MGFSLRDLIKVAAPVVATVAPGPIGQIATQVGAAAASGARLSTKPADVLKAAVLTSAGLQTSAINSLITMPSTSSGYVPITGGVGATAAAGAGAMPLLMRGAQFARQMAVQALRAGKAGVHYVERGLAYISSPALGRVFDGRQVARFARRWGPAAAATAMGVTIEAVLLALARNETVTRRRRRGWSSRDSRQFSKLTRRAVAIRHQIDAAAACRPRTRRVRKC